MDFFATEGTTSIDSYQKVIKLAGKPLVDGKLVTQKFIQACIDRETNFPTGLKLSEFLGIAIPHGSSEFVNASAVSFVRLNESVDFGLMEDKSQQVPCKYAFNLALSNGGEHIGILRKLMRLFQDERFIKNINELDIEDIPAFLQEKLEN